LIIRKLILFKVSKTRKNHVEILLKNIKIDVFKTFIEAKQAVFGQNLLKFKV